LLVKNELNTVPKNYAVKEKPETPFSKAEQKWDDRIGSARVQAFNWRIAFFVTMVLCFVLTGGLIYQSAKATVTPYVVEVGQDGIAKAVGPAQAAQYQPKDAEIKYFLSQFIQKTRSVPSDPVLFKQNWIAAYSYMNRSTAEKVNALMAKDPQITLLQNKNTVQVSIISILPTTANCWQIRWKEEAFDNLGQSKGSSNMTGLFTITIQPPQNEKELVNNPLGIVLTDLSWDRDF